VHNVVTYRNDAGEEEEEEQCTGKVRVWGVAWVPPMNSGLRREGLGAAVGRAV
jgi:hypothetical protein